MERRLSEFLDTADIQRDGAFAALGHADSTLAGTLAYCDSVFYVSIANENANISCVITTPDLASRICTKKGVACAEYPRTTFYRLHERLHEDGGRGDGRNRIHPSAIVSPTARLGRDVSIAERVVITGDVVLGDGSFVDVGAVIGAEGLLYLDDGGCNHRIRHQGSVVIGQRVTILANAVIARGIYPRCPTAIEDHAIVGIASTIGHEANVGRNAVVSGNCVIARRAHIGEDAWIGSSSMVREYVRVGARARVKAGSVVIDDVPEGNEVSGNFAISHRRRVLQYLKERK